MSTTRRYTLIITANTTAADLDFRVDVKFTSEDVQ